MSLTKEQETFLNRFTLGKWRENSNGKITVIGSFDCSDSLVREFPVEFETVTKHFDCRHCDLDTLKGAPKIVGEYFDCSSNWLTSLEFAPKQLGGNLRCSGNRLNSMNYCPYLTDENLYMFCQNNMISDIALHDIYEEIQKQMRESGKKAQYVYNYEEDIISKVLNKISHKDLEKMNLSPEFYHKYRGNIAASNLGLI